MQFMLDAIGAGLAPRIGDRDWKDIWLDSPEYRETREEIDRIKTEALALPAPEKSHESTCKFSMHGASQYLSNPGVTDATPFWVQLTEVVKRNNRALWRMPEYVFSRLFVHAFISLFVSLSFLQLGHGTRDLQYRVFGM